MFDNGSNDGSEQIANGYNNVVWDRQKYYIHSIDEVLLRNIKNSCWKDSRDADWVFVGDVDEIIYHPHGVEKFLHTLKRDKYTIVKPHAYDMVVDSLPVHDGMIYDHEDFRKGMRIVDHDRMHICDGHTYDKCCVFSPKHIDEINYTLGAHVANPIGDTNIFHRSECKLLHYKYMHRQTYITRNLECKYRSLKDSSSCNSYGLEESVVSQRFTRYLNSPKLHKVL